MSPTIPSRRSRHYQCVREREDWWAGFTPATDIIAGREKGAPRNDSGKSGERKGSHTRRVVKKNAHPTGTTCGDVECGDPRCARETRREVRIKYQRRLTAARRKYQCLQAWVPGTKRSHDVVVCPTSLQSGDETAHISYRTPPSIRTVCPDALSAVPTGGLVPAIPRALLPLSVFSRHVAWGVLSHLFLYDMAALSFCPVRESPLGIQRVCCTIPCDADYVPLRQPVTYLSVSIRIGIETDTHGMYKSGREYDNERSGWSTICNVPIPFGKATGEALLPSVRRTTATSTDSEESTPSFSFAHPANMDIQNKTVAEHKAAARELIAELRELSKSGKVNLYNSDWLRTWDLSQEELRATVIVTLVLQHLYAANVDCRMFASGLAVSEFRDNSTRTRFSFMNAASFLGLTPTELEPSKSQIAHGETIRETAAMISFMTEVVGIRDDKYIHEGHAYQLSIAEALEAAHQEGVLNQRPCVINLQCDEDHPTQSMSDLVHIGRHFGSLEEIKGKKIAMCWAYSPSYGKPLSVAQSLVTLLPRFGADLHLAYPEGYDLLPEVLEEAKKQAAAHGGKLTVGHSMDEACADAEVVYCKSWCPYTILEKKAELVRAGKMVSPEMDQLEADGLCRNKDHMDWTVTEALMANTKPTKDLPEALYMHCLPADITDVSCKAGEVEAAVFERQRVGTYHEAKNKPFVQAAMIALCRKPEIADTLTTIVDNDKKRAM
ncbi:aspartate carbamoyltransferase [Kipferlia bialata]|uniref:ornithine carbamoyltransferase n=1 Tax=Kipferlia bialata TaxID=797122 RepID=A0A9K3CMR6_9EUKA|nr:aspartate carbamoyltransferase [Kipferlia bialata]|eukprot:g25.t1